MPQRQALALLLRFVFCLFAASLTGAAQDRGAVEGIVKGPGGAPVEGAMVAVNTGGILDRQEWIVTTDTAGIFRVENLTPGTYGITATIDRYAGVFQGNVRISAGQTTQGIQLTFEGTGPTISGTVYQADGSPSKGASVSADRVGPDRGDIFWGMTDPQGAYRIRVGPGAYVVKAQAAGRYSDRQTVELKDDRSADFRLDAVPRDAPAPPQVVEWFRNHAIRLSTTEAGHGFADMQPLKEIVGSARIVSVGEATHGTHEFFQLKHRILEFLVNKMGFTVFAIEANWPESLAVNDYVLEGKGDPAAALAGMYFWTWNTEEVLEMIHWIRRYNADPAHRKKLKFYGFDMQTSSVAVANVLAYLRRLDAEFAKVAEEELSPLDARSKALVYTNQPREAKEKMTADLDAMVRRFEEKKNDYVQRSSEQEWVRIRQNLQIVRQAHENLVKRGTDPAFRDRAMAENVKWLLDQEPPGTKMMLWAHNGHVMKSGYAGAASMGMQLHKILGNDIVVFGFAFNQGSFQAVEEGKALRPFTLQGAPKGSLDATLAETGIPLFALNLRQASMGPAGPWLDSMHLTRSFGAVYSDTWPYRLITTRAARDYDVLLFVERTTRARKNTTGPGANPLPIRSGQLPAGWSVWSPILYDYEIGADHRVFHTGRESCHIKAQVPFPRGPASLMQVFRADDYRGKRVRLSAYIKSEEVKDSAYLWLRVVDADLNVLAYDNMAERPIRGTNHWQKSEIVLDVPAKSMGISLGLQLYSSGQVWADDWKLEVVDPTVVPTVKFKQTSDSRLTADDEDAKRWLKLYSESPQHPVALISGWDNKSSTRIDHGAPFSSH